MQPEDKISDNIGWCLESAHQQQNAWLTHDDDQVVSQNDATNLDYLWDAVGSTNGRGSSCHQMQRCEFQTLSLLLGSGKQSAASVLAIEWRQVDAHDQLIQKWVMKALHMFVGEQCDGYIWQMQEEAWKKLVILLFTRRDDDHRCCGLACYIAQVFAKDVVGYLVDRRTVKKV